jgi:hypothetical protein
MGDFHPDAHVNGLSGCNLIAWISNNLSATSAAIFWSKISIPQK